MQINPAAVRVVRLNGGMRDVLMIAIGILTLNQTPGSIELFGAQRTGSIAWSLMLLVGGVVSLVGSIARRPIVECAGCFMVGGGFIVWTIAALTQPDLDSVNVAVALVFLSGTNGQLWRGLTVASGVYLDHATDQTTDRRRD